MSKKNAPKRGRPELKPEDRKQKRQIMLPPACWKHLDDIDSSRGGTNRVLEGVIRQLIKTDINKIKNAFFGPRNKSTHE